MAAYELRFHKDAFSEWKNLDSGVRARLKKKLIKRLENPIIESSQLRNELTGLFVIRLHADGIRLVYKVETEEHALTVVGIGKREDLIAYQIAEKRLPDFLE